MAKFNLRSKRTWKKILSIGLGILLTVGAVFGISALVSKSEETTKEINPKFSIGALTEDGKYSESKESIYSDAFECQGLSVQLAFDHNISYEIFYYNKYSDFISSTGILTENYNTVDNLMPANTVFARIEITPTEDSSISWYEKSKYSKQLTIEVFKDQTDLSNTEPLVDLFKIDSTKLNQIIRRGSDGKISFEENSATNVSSPINLSNIKKLSVDFGDSITKDTLFYFTTSDGTIINDLRYSIGGNVTDIINVDSSASLLYIVYSNTQIVSVYKLA